MPGEWARCIAPAIPSSTATSRSRSCQTSSRPIERLARFTREAQALAALSHTNIAHVYGVVELPAGAESLTQGSALVMEFADGEDLSAIIARGPLPFADALPIARQIADALERLDKEIKRRSNVVGIFPNSAP